MLERWTVQRADKYLKNAARSVDKNRQRGNCLLNIYDINKHTNNTCVHVLIVVIINVLNSLYNDFATHSTMYNVIIHYIHDCDL